MNCTLRVSIVSYAPNRNLLRRTLLSLIAACERANNAALIDRTIICLINNGPGDGYKRELGELAREFDGACDCLALELIGDGRNIGFGAGHNLSFDPASCDFHLVLNPDVEFDANALVSALSFMRSHPECGMLSPSVVNDKGEREYPCKQFPAVVDLALRGFAPKWLRDIFAKRLADYEIQEEIADEIVWDPPIISGCFMLLRTSVIAAAKGFDPRFFLYFEDFDLSLRVRKISQIAYVPSVKIVHHGGNAAKKGWRHIYLFVRSGIQFFNKHGWKWI